MRRCCCSLLAEDRFPAIWMPSTELRDLRALLLHRHQWVRLRTRVQNALHAIVLGYGVQRGHALWNRDGQAMLASLPLPPHAAHRRDELQALYQAHSEGVGSPDAVIADRYRAGESIADLVTDYGEDPLNIEEACACCARHCAPRGGQPRPTLRGCRTGSGS